MLAALAMFEMMAQLERASCLYGVAGKASMCAIEARNISMQIKKSCFQIWCQLSSCFEKKFYGVGVFGTSAWRFLHKWFKWNDKSVFYDLACFLNYQYTFFLFESKSLYKYRMWLNDINTFWKSKVSSLRIAWIKLIFSFLKHLKLGLPYLILILYFLLIFKILKI